MEGVAHPAEHAAFRPAFNGSLSAEISAVGRNQKIPPRRTKNTHANFDVAKLGYSYTVNTMDAVSQTNAKNVTSLFALCGP